MDHNDDFYGGMLDEQDADKQMVDAAEHLVRLKRQAGQERPEDELEKEAFIGPALDASTLMGPSTVGHVIGKKRGRKMVEEGEELEPASFAAQMLIPGAYGYRMGKVKGYHNETKRRRRELEKEASFDPSSGLPEAVRGDTAPRVIPGEGGPRVAWDGRKGYNYTGLEHGGKHHILVDHHASGRVGHLILNPETGAVEQNELHPSHKHMGPQFQERALLMRPHLGGPAPMTPGEKLAAALGNVVKDDPKKKPFLKKHEVKKIREALPSTMPTTSGRILELALDKLEGKKTKKRSEAFSDSQDFKRAKTAAMKELIKDPMNVSMALGAILGTGIAFHNAKKPGEKIKPKSPQDKSSLESMVTDREAASIIERMKNRSSEFGKGIAKAMRDHPVKGSVAVGGTAGALVGRRFAQALGAGK